MKIIPSILIMLFAFAFFAAAQEKQTVLEQRAAEVVGIINQPKDLDKVFAPGFLQAVPPEKFAEISKSLTDNYGKAVGVKKITPKSEFAGQIQILFEKDTVASMTLSLEPSPPHLINGLLITGVEETSETLEEIVAELKKLPGQTGFAAAKLSVRDFDTIIAHNPDQAFAIGSTFKFYVLAELVRSVTAGERKWSDVIELKERSLPSGQMQNWPTGAPVTLHTLASLMISISDNTATDQLIETLGREKIEKMLTAAGNDYAEMNRPFLKTIEMFKIKAAVKQNYAQIFISKDEKGRRSMVENEIAAFNKEEIDLANFLKEPTYISEIEWFASPSDLIRLMKWLRDNSEKGEAEKARGVMTINKALPEATAKNWNYVGYKGGSEPGVISMTYLLETPKGEWFVVTGSWNDEKSPVAEAQFVGLMQKAVKILWEKHTIKRTSL
ncbi:MAG: serine hydrolase [Pyrinomonadaceae bacterium]